MSHPQRRPIPSTACGLLAAILLLAGCAAGAPASSPTPRIHDPEPSLAGPYPSGCDQLEPCPGWNVSISGTVTDPDGRPVEGATVEVEGLGGREMPPPITDRQGHFDYTDHALEPGTATITTTADGYEPATTSATLQPGEKRVVDLVLRPL